MDVLAIDIGTSACKVGVFDSRGLVALAKTGYQALATSDGRVELDAEAVWQRIRRVIREAVQQSPSCRIGAVCVCSMGEAVVPVDANGRAVGPSIMPHDRRGMEYVERLTQDFSPEHLYRINPNPIGPQYSLAKILWTRDFQPDQHAATHTYLLWADYVAMKLGAPPTGTASLASRTLLYDVEKQCWSREMLEWAGLDARLFPEIVKGGRVIGIVRDDVARDLGLGPDALIVAGGHDQCANALGSGCVAPGQAVVGMGTYESYSTVLQWPKDIGSFQREGMGLEPHVVDGLYVALLHNYSGLLVEWFRRAFAADGTDESQEAILERLGQEMPSGPTRLLFLPHNEPPQWPAYARETAGAFVGMKSGTTRGEMFRALLEGITFFFVDGVQALARTGFQPREYLASGGGARSDAWMQIRADMIGVPFTRLDSMEGPLAGAAILAALSLGLFRNHEEAVREYVRHGRTFTPNPENHARYQELHTLYRQLQPSLAGIFSGLA